MTSYEPVNIDALEPEISKRVITVMLTGMTMNDMGGNKAPFQIPPAVAFSIVQALEKMPRKKDKLSRTAYMRGYMQRYRAKKRAEQASSSGTPPASQA